MLRTMVLLALTALVLNTAAPADQPFQPTPMVKVVAPTPAKVGQQVLLTGQYLGKDYVEAVYLTVGDDTHIAEIKAQTTETITIKVPADIKPGRFGIMVLMKAGTPRYIDEPVSINIE